MRNYVQIAVTVCLRRISGVYTTCIWWDSPARCGRAHRHYSQFKFLIGIKLGAGRQGSGQKAHQEPRFCGNTGAVCSRRASSGRQGCQHCIGKGPGPVLKDARLTFSSPPPGLALACVRYAKLSFQGHACWNAGGARRWSPPAGRGLRVPFPCEPSPAQFRRL
jgi:hypothetical protein